MRVVRDEYARAAKGVADAVKAAVDKVSDMVDKAFWAAVAAIAGGVLIETGVGAAALWSVAALECRGVVDAWPGVVQCWERAKYAAETFNAALVGATGDTGYFQAHPPPEVEYSHPGAN